VVFASLRAVLAALVMLPLGVPVLGCRINVMFALVLTPLLFTGASQYPWASLDHLPWFQVLTACNPLTYVNEGMRAAMVPEVPTSRLWCRCSSWS
jgi:ABC-2 type transport system permease protein